MVDSFGFGAFADVSVIRAVGIWDYILFFGSIAVIGIAVFGAYKTIKHYKNRNSISNIFKTNSIDKV